MKIDESTVQAVSSEEFKTLAFRVDQKMAQIIFRDKLYSAEGKIRVIVQEYMANARDAHRVAGKSDTPIDVTLPTNLAPEFIVRDYGNGIPPNVIEDIFVVYGASTKKNSNLENGGYGIGAKCAFSYVNAFSVTTTVGGIRYIYAASIDSEGMNQFTLLDSGPATGPDGTEVRVPIKTSDIVQLRLWVQEVAHAWTPRPNITNATLEYKDVESELAGERWELYHYNSPFSYRMFFRGITVTVDDIPYTMTSDQSRAIGGSVEILYSLLCEKNKCLVLHFRVGEVTVPPQRESIDITAKTKHAVAQAVDRFTQAMVDKAVESLKAAVLPLEKVALALNESFDLLVARSVQGAFKDEAAASGREFATAPAGMRVYEGRFSNRMFRDFTELDQTSLAQLAKPRASNKFVIDTKGKKMSPTELKKLARASGKVTSGDVFMVAIHDMASFTRVTEVDADTLQRVGGYTLREREVVPALPRSRRPQYFFLKEYALEFSEYSDQHHFSSKKMRVDQMPTDAVFVDLENNQPLFQGKPITHDRLCELALLYKFLTSGFLGQQLVYGWEERFSNEHSPSEYTFLEDALMDAAENVLMLPTNKLDKMAALTEHCYKPSGTWPAVTKADSLDPVVTILGYNSEFVQTLQRVIILEANGYGEQEESRSQRYAKKIWGLLDEEPRSALDEVLRARIQRLYDVRDEFAALAYSTPMMPVFLGLLSNSQTLHTRKDGVHSRVDILQLVIDSLKDFKPINPLFKVQP